MSGIKSNEDQFQALTDNPNEEPFVMLNLLKFKKEGGRESYFRYIKESGSHVGDVGAKVIYFGIPKELLQGSEDWDLLMLVQYPSRKAFLEMIQNSDYQKVQQYRVEGVERAVLYATDPVKFKAILST
ncbi:MAG: DUF1330 domain-containing protein [Deltaproteobacteria bacterium]|nr:DUF1330 domain-containing protein [Deltaproteobacteria bacterium]